MSINYYEILGISKDATDKEIKSAYRKLSKELHPDTATGDEEKFKKVREAYDVLSDPQKRQQYDNPNIFDPFGGININFNGHDISDIFFNMRGNHNRVRGGDIQITLTIDAKESYLGVSKEVNYKRNLNNGSEEIRSVSIDIPKGIGDQSRVRINGGGHQGTRMDGDLFVYIQVVPYENYERAGNDLIYRMNITPIDILLGKEEFVDLFDKKIKVKIPECVNINKPLRISKLGYNGGNLVVLYNVTTPNKLTEDVKVLLNQIKDKFN